MLQRGYSLQAGISRLSMLLSTQDVLPHQSSAPATTSGPCASADVLTLTSASSWLNTPCQAPNVQVANDSAARSQRPLNWTSMAAGAAHSLAPIVPGHSTAITGLVRRIVSSSLPVQPGAHFGTHCQECSARSRHHEGSHCSARPAQHAFQGSSHSCRQHGLGGSSRGWPEGRRHATSLAFRVSVEQGWLMSVRGRCKAWGNSTFPQLKGREEEMVKRVEQSFQQLMDKHGAALEPADADAHRQLKMVCMAVATHQVLMAEVASEAEVAYHINISLGGLFMPMMKIAQSSMVLAQSLVLRRSPLALATKTLQDVASDLRGACSCAIVSHPASDGGDARAAALGEPGGHAPPTNGPWAEMIISSCLFQRVLQAEGLPQLLSNFCCTHNMAWFQAFEGRGIDSRQTDFIGAGDACCRICISPKQ